MKKLVRLLCKDKGPLANCCCSALVSARWRKLIPQAVKTQVAGLSLKTDFDTTVKVADNVWRSLQPDQQAVAAVQVAPPVPEVEHVAAVGSGGRGRGQQRGRGSRQRGGGRGGRGGSNSGAQSDSQDSGPPPPDNCCKMHKRHKKKAFYCSDPDNCPWRNYKYQPLDSDKN